MKTIINLAVKWLGLGKLWGALDGKKAYLGGAAGILGGAAEALRGLSCLLQKVVALASPADALELLKSLPNDPCSVSISGGIAAVGLGLAAVGLRHSDEKLAAKIEAPAPK